MSDWDFLYEMHYRGYSAADIADAAAVGYAPWEAKYIRFGDEPKLKKQPPVQKSAPLKPQVDSSPQKAKALQAMEMLRQAGILTRPQFLSCKAAINKK